MQGYTPRRVAVFLIPTVPADIRPGPVSKIAASLNGTEQTCPECPSTGSLGHPLPSLLIINYSSAEGWDSIVAYCLCSVSHRAEGLKGGGGLCHSSDS
jgi:hypothetical protein